MVVTGLHLLGGARADANRVRSGADRAVVEGRFTTAEISTGSRGADRRDPGFLGSGPRRRRQRHRAAVGQPRRAVAGLPRRAQRAGEIAEHLHRPAADPARPERPAAADAARRAARGAGPVRRRRRPGWSAIGRLRDDWRRPAAISIDRTDRARELAQEADRLKFALDEIDTVDPQPGRGRGAGRRHPPALRTRRAARGGVGGRAGAVRGRRRSDGQRAGAGDRRRSAGRCRRWRPPTTPCCRRWARQLGEALDRCRRRGPRARRIPGGAADRRQHVGDQAGPPGRAAHADPQVRRRHRRGAGLGRASRATGWPSSTSPRRRWPAWNARVDELGARLVAAAAELTKVRTKAAKALAKAVTAELAGLAMADAEFTIEVSPLPAQADDSAPLTLPSGQTRARRLATVSIRSSSASPRTAAARCCR